MSDKKAETFRSEIRLLIVGLAINNLRKGRKNISLDEFNPRCWRGVANGKHVFHLEISAELKFWTNV